jgi:hypothetical protein
VQNMRTERVSVHLIRRIEILRPQSNKGFDKAVHIPATGSRSKEPESVKRNGLRGLDLSRPLIDQLSR